MTDKERIAELEDMLARARALLAIERLSEEPQHPKPGTVVELKHEHQDHWQYGIAGDEGAWVDGGILFMWSHIEYHPVEILRERMEAGE